MQKNPPRVINFLCPLILTAALIGEENADPYRRVNWYALIALVDLWDLEVFLDNGRIT